MIAVCGCVESGGAASVLRDVRRVARGLDDGPAD